jgi:hypothetical protein
MPLPVEFEEANLLLKGHPEQDIRDMHVYHTPEMVISKWKLSPEEIASVNENGFFWLGTMNCNRPVQPQAIWVESPFRQELVEPVAEEVVG